MIILVISMNSRMSKYYDNTETSSKSRSKKNANLYKSMYEEETYSNIEGIVETPKGNEINIEKIREMILRREQEENSKNQLIKKTLEVDIPALVESQEEEKNYDIMCALKQAKEDKDNLRENKYRRLDDEYLEDIKNPTIAVLGSAFKGGTDDWRESPALQIIEIMLAHDVKIKLYDPEAMPNTKAILGDLITYCNSAYEAIGGADILAVLTDWQEFKSLELEKIKVLMTRPQIADFRNNFDYHKAKELGFEIKSLGRK